MGSQLKMICKYLTIVLFVFALVIPAEMSAATVDRKERPKKEQPKKKAKKHPKKKTKKRVKCQNGCKPGCGHGETSIPLDGGLSFLVLGAAAFGVRKLRNNKKTKE